jgi:hypothetical protein
MDLTELFNSTFGTDVSVSQIRAYKRNHRLSSGLTGRYQPGSTPYTKGKKKYWSGGEESQFKKGHKPYNYMPVGSERINGEGYIDIKIADPNIWRGKHLILWEQHNGSVPKGHAVLFGDGNRMNVDIDNLVLVTRAQLAILNRKRFIFKNAEFTRTGLILADIYQKIGQRKSKDTT